MDIDIAELCYLVVAGTGLLVLVLQLVFGEPFGSICRVSGGPS